MLPLRSESHRYPNTGHPSSLAQPTLSILVASLFTLGLALSQPAHATDGVAEINQTCAVQTGCFPGDTPGYPVRITGQGGRSYRLTSDLIVPDENTDGIVLAQSDIGIDLNNFSIIHQDCLSGAANCTPTSGSGSGIDLTTTAIRGTSVKNGSIVGMGAYGVFLGSHSEVTGLRVRSNRIDGIATGISSNISENSASGNGRHGITGGINSTLSGNTTSDNGDDGIVADDSSTVSGNTASGNGDDGIVADFGSTVSGNTANGNGDKGIVAFAGATVSRNSAFNNGGDGIFASSGCNVQHNTVRSNDGYGLRLSADSAYLGNVVTDNTTGTMTGAGTNRGTNYCSGTGTGSAFCP